MIGLLSATTRASAILLVALGLVWLLRTRAASLRHAVLAIAMACAAMAPALGAFLPSWTPRVAWADIAHRASATMAVATPIPTMPGDDMLSAAPSRVGAARASVRERATPPPATPSARARSWNLPRILEIGYAIGALAAFATLIAGLLRLTWLSARAEPVRSDRWARHAALVARAYGLRQHVRLRQSRDAALLATWGVVGPHVLLPAGSDQWPDARIRAVLFHELAHVRRHDWIVQVLASALRAVYWFNPLVWLACSRLRHESERACDDCVVSHGVDAREYADHLLTLARMFNGRHAASLPALPMARPSSLRTRVAAILDPAANHARATRGSIAGATAILLLTTTPIAAFHVAAPPVPRAVSALPIRPEATHFTRLDASTTPAAPAAAAPTLRVPRPLAPDMSPVDPSPKTTAIAVLDLIQSTPLADPTSMLSAHTFLRSMVNALQRAARAVIDDDGSDPASGMAKARALLGAITNAANAATTVLNRSDTGPDTARALTPLAAALREQAADLRAIVPPIDVPTAGAGSSPARRAAVAALGAVQTARDDDALWQHAFLATQLENVERAAQSALDDDGTSQRGGATRPSALSNVLLAAANAASNIGGRANETEHVRSAVSDLAATLRRIAGQLIDTIQTPFAIRLPPDVEPERVSIFYSLALSGRMPDSVTTKSGVFDYTIDTKAAHDLKLLIVVPGYRIVTAQFTDAEMRSAERYMPQLVPSSATLRGRVVDSSRRPIRNFGLSLGYELHEAIGYFCGKCMLDGQIPVAPLGTTRTDDTGNFSFVVPDVHGFFFSGKCRWRRRTLPEQRVARAAGHRRHAAAVALVRERHRREADRHHAHRPRHPQRPAREKLPQGARAQRRSDNLRLRCAGHIGQAAANRAQRVLRRCPHEWMSILRCPTRTGRHIRTGVAAGHIRSRVGVLVGWRSAAPNRSLRWRCRHSREPTDGRPATVRPCAFTHPSRCC